MEGKVMIKVEYKNKELIEKEYLKLFDDWITQNQKNWCEIRSEICKKTEHPYYYPVCLKDLIKAPIRRLIEIYYDYVTIADNLNCRALIKKMFTYRGSGSSKVAGFFMKYAKELEICTCCYCDTAYVNAYKTVKGMRNHFDLDHYLPKSKCPLAALSLYNFVPSCPVCNERLKKDFLLGDDVVSTDSLCPTSELYQFTEIVKMMIMPKQAKDVYFNLSFEDNSDKFRICFKMPPDSIYRKEVELFKLEERYEFHKCEALNLMDKCRDYPPAHIKMISNALRYPVSKVKEDIFRKEFLNKHQRIFTRLNSDIYNMYNNKGVNDKDNVYNVSDIL